MERLHRALHREDGWGCRHPDHLLDTRAGQAGYQPVSSLQEDALLAGHREQCRQRSVRSGQPRNRRNQHAKYRLLTVAELYPEILDPRLDGSDTLPSCSSVEALKRQEPFVNQVLANHALALLARLFRHREVSYQEASSTSPPARWRLYR